MLDQFARFVTHRSIATLVIVMFALTFFALQLPKVRADFTPSDLFARYEEEERLAEEFRATFGNTDNVLLVLVEAPDIYSVEALQLVHTIAVGLRTFPWAGRVDAVTLLPLPSPRPTSLDPAGVYAALYDVGSAPATQARALVARLAGTEPPPASPEPPAWLLALSQGDRPAAAPAVAGETVTSDEAARIRAQIPTSPLLVGRLVSRDATLTAIAVQLAPGFERAGPIAEAVAEAVEWVEAQPAGDGIVVRLGGLPYLRSALSDRIRSDQAVMMPASVLICVFLLALAFRWVPALVLPLLAVLISAVMLVGAMALFGESFNIINNIIPLLIIIIGISNAFHLLNRYFEELRAKRSKLESIENAVRAMTVACFLTSFTTAVGFGTLVVSRTQILQGFGLWAAIGVMLAYVVTLTFLPAAMARVGVPRRVETAEHNDRLERVLERAVRAGIRRPWPVLLVATAFLVGCVVIGLRVKVDSAVLDQFDSADELYTTTRLIEDRLSGVRPLEVYLRASEPGRFHDPEVLAALDRVAQQVRPYDGVIGTQTYADLLREVRVAATGDAESRSQPLASQSEIERYATLLASGARDPSLQWVSADRTRLRLNVQLRDFGARATVTFAEQLQRSLDQELAGFSDVDYRLTGDAYTSSVGLRAVIGDLGSSLGLAVVIIFGFIAVLFRSVRLALVSIPPNLTPLLLTLAFMSLWAIPLNAATVIIFSVSIGMGVDGTIHIFARVGEELRNGVPVSEAIVAAARGTGRAIVLTNLSLLLGFGVMLLSAFVPVQRFGMLVGVTMFASTLSTVIVLPALLSLALPRPTVERIIAPPV